MICAKHGYACKYHCTGCISETAKAEGLEQGLRIAEEIMEQMSRYMPMETMLKLRPHWLSMIKAGHYQNGPLPKLPVDRAAPGGEK